MTRLLAVAAYPIALGLDAASYALGRTGQRLTRASDRVYAAACDVNHFTLTHLPKEKHD